MSKTTHPLLKNISPLQALIQMEEILRNHGDVYHIAMDEEAKIGLGQWLKNMIREAQALQDRDFKKLKKVRSYANLLARELDQF